MIALLVAQDDHVYYDGGGGGDLVQQHPSPSPSCPAWEHSPRPDLEKNAEDAEEQDGSQILHVEQRLHYSPPVMAPTKRTPASVTVSFIDDNFTIFEDTNNPNIEEDDDSSSSTSSSSSLTTILTSSTATTQCHDILHITEYTADEIAECWYTRADYFDIREDMKEELTYFYSAVNDSTVSAAEADDYCHRGLERRTALAKTLRQTTRAQAIRAVVSEVQYQQHHGYTNSQMLADVYREYSGPAADLARSLGEQDARDARRTCVYTTAIAQHEETIH